MVSVRGRAALLLVSLLSLGAHCSGRQDLHDDRRASKSRFKLRSAGREARQPPDVLGAFNSAAGIPKRENSTASTASADLTERLEQRIGQLDNSKQFAQCRQDPDVPPVGRSGRYLIAVNLHNNQDLMPHFISQLLELLSQASPENFFISIYESGDDQTAKWLELLQELLEKLDVPSLIVTNGLSREDGQDRIAFLADMRNRALAPLFGSDGFWSAKSGWPADKVIFINDVFFCAGDILRLLAHPGDVVCGMDFAHFMYDPDEMYPAGKLRPFGPYGPHLSDGQAGNDEHFTFYDMWVARDANGQPFSNYRPYVSHLYSLERIQKGLPFPVTCCWNGLVVLDAEPFRQGIRFRAHDPDECSASEVSLMCEDFQRAGHGQMIVDPGVRQAYTVEDAAELYGERVGFIPPTTFKEMKAAPPISYEYVPQKTHIMCCDKFEDGDHADWENCHPVDIYKLKSQVKYVKQGHSHHSHVPTSSSSRRRG